tara:strand:+ start:864 stop:1880 length:1017 start_codon:yes stop_codon:yes gene_type:complete
MNVAQTSLDPPHFPVMLKEIIEICSPKKGGNFVDCTFGSGGYTKELLKFPNTKVIALDRDKGAITEAEKLKKKFSKRFSFYNEKFSNLDLIINEKNDIDTFIFDLGISSNQLLDLDRGFSFKSNKRIDMNMGLSEISAEEVLNDFDEKNLKLIIKTFGEEKEGSRIAKNIVRAREKKRISLVPEFVKIIEASKRKIFKKKINVCTKTFQALRIFVNKEITELVEGIAKATKFLKADGKIVVVTFHSIEDKIIKFFFNYYSKNRSKPSRYLPEDDALIPILFQKNNNKFLKASPEEIKINPKSRSAKLRFIIRNNEKFKNPDELKRKFKRYLDLENINV